MDSLACFVSSGARIAGRRTSAAHAALDLKLTGAGDDITLRAIGPGGIFGESEPFDLIGSEGSTLEIVGAGAKASSGGGGCRTGERTGSPGGGTALMLLVLFVLCKARTAAKDAHVFYGDRRFGAATAEPPC